MKKSFVNIIAVCFVMGIFLPNSICAYPPPPTEGKVVVTAPSLTVREGPERSAPAIDRVHRGDILLLRGRAPRGGWLHVQIPSGGLGWVAEKFTEHVDSPGFPPTEGKVVVTAPSLTVREGPERSAPAIDRVHRGDILLLRGRAPRGGWLHVQIPSGGLGWVAEKFTEHVDSPGFPPTEGKVVVTAPSLTVREGPERSAPAIDRVHRGDILLLRGRAPRGGWLHVQIPSGGLGWVAEKFTEPVP